MKNTILFASALVMAAACTTTPPPPTEPVSKTEDVRAETPRQVCTPETFDIFFEQGATDITPEAGQLLTAIALKYQTCDLSLIEIEGHADADGSAEANLVVSQKRAESVSTALTDLSVDTDKIRIIPMGERKAITAEGEERPMNRKTVVRFVP